MKMTARLSLTALLASTGAAWGQADTKQTSPLEAATASKAEQPVTVAKAGQTMTSDADILRLVRMLTGSFASEPKGETPALRMGAAAVSVGGLDNAVLFEITRADNPSEPFREGIMFAYRRKGELRLRVFDFATPGLKDTLVGVWAAPEAFPKIDTASLTPNLDMPLRVEGDSGFAGDTAQPVPTTRDGAIEMTSSVRIGKDVLGFSDTGFDSDGKQVWGLPGGERAIFRRTETPEVTARKTDDGLVIITLVPAPKDAEAVVPGGEIAAHYTGWLRSGVQFDTSHKGANEPLRIHVPGPVIKGWNEGLAGIAKGERRRLIIPPALGWGDRAAGRGLVPANSSLVFDVECVYVDNSQPTPPPPQPPPPAAAPGAAPPTPGSQPPPAQPPAQQPATQGIGTPPNSGTPEKPR